jgi:hypothetical protein
LGAGDITGVGVGNGVAVGRGLAVGSGVGIAIGVDGLAGMAVAAEEQATIIKTIKAGSNSSLVLSRRIIPPLLGQVPRLEIHSTTRLRWY